MFACREPGLCSQGFCCCLPSSLPLNTISVFSRGYVVTIDRYFSIYHILFKWCSHHDVLWLGMLACGYYLTRKEIMFTFPLVAKTLWIAVLAIILCYSFMTDKLMYVVKWGATGMNSISYMQNDSSCTYDVSSNGHALATCTLTLKTIATPRSL